MSFFKLTRIFTTISILTVVIGCDKSKAVEPSEFTVFYPDGYCSYWYAIIRGQDTVYFPIGSMRKLKNQSRDPYNFLPPSYFTSIFGRNDSLLRLIIPPTQLKYLSTESSSSSLPSEYQSEKGIERISRFETRLIDQDTVWVIGSEFSGLKQLIDSSKYYNYLDFRRRVDSVSANVTIRPFLSEMDYDAGLQTDQWLNKEIIIDSIISGDSQIELKGFSVAKYSTLANSSNVSGIILDEISPDATLFLTPRNSSLKTDIWPSADSISSEPYDAISSKRIWHLGIKNRCLDSNEGLSDIDNGNAFQAWLFENLNREEQLKMIKDFQFRKGLTVIKEEGSEPASEDIKYIEMPEIEFKYSLEDSENLENISIEELRYWFSNAYNAIEILSKEQSWTDQFTLGVANKLASGETVDLKNYYLGDQIQEENSDHTNKHSLPYYNYTGFKDYLPDPLLWDQDFSVELKFLTTKSDNVNANQPVADILIDDLRRSVFIANKRLESLQSDLITSLTIICTTNGKHSSKSNHYGGTAVDIVAINDEYLARTTADSRQIYELQYAMNQAENIRENYGPLLLKKYVKSTDQWIQYKESVYSSHGGHIHFAVRSE